MLNDIKQTLEKLESLIKAATPDLTAVEGAGLYAGIRLVLEDIMNHADENNIGDTAYISEKVVNIGFHCGAVLGFDITNGHDEEQHRVWALGDLSSLKNILKNSAS